MNDTTGHDYTNQPQDDPSQNAFTQKAEPAFVPKENSYIPSPIIVEKLEKLVETKKHEQAERERLATMPKQPYVREEPRVGRNDPCPCGSGKKYKKCHMGKEE